MSKGFRIFNRGGNAHTTNEWDRINAAIMDGDGKRNMTSKDVSHFEELVEEHDSSQFSDEAIARTSSPALLERNGGTHWKPLDEYKPTCSYMPTWTMEDPGEDKDNLYWPYIPNDKELLEEILRDRKGAKQMIKEHKKTVGWEIQEDSKKHYHRKEGF